MIGRSNIESIVIAEFPQRQNICCANAKPSSAKDKCDEEVKLMPFDIKELATSFSSEDSKLVLRILGFDFLQTTVCKNEDGLKIPNIYIT